MCSLLCHHILPAGKGCLFTPVNDDYIGRAGRQGLSCVRTVVNCSAFLQVGVYYGFLANCTVNKLNIAPQQRTYYEGALQHTKQLS